MAEGVDIHIALCAVLFGLPLGVVLVLLIKELVSADDSQHH